MARPAQNKELLIFGGIRLVYSGKNRIGHVILDGKKGNKEEGNLKIMRKMRRSYAKTL